MFNFLIMKNVLMIKTYVLDFKNNNHIHTADNNNFDRINGQKCLLFYVISFFFCTRSMERKVVHSYYFSSGVALPSGIYHHFNIMQLFSVLYTILF